MNFIKLNLDHFNFFCPVTGKQITSEYDGFEPSKATVFTWVDEIQEFEYVTEEFKEQFEKHTNEVDEYECINIEEVSKHLKDYDGLVIFQITIDGMACGPVSSTVHIGIDMNYDINEEKDKEGKIDEN